MDTAIYLYNKGNATKASHYLEVALFGNKHNTDKLKIEDYRKGHFDGKDYEDPQPTMKDETGADKNIEGAANLGKVGIYYIIANRDYDNNGIVEDFEFFSSSILNMNISNIDLRLSTDPNVAWILTLRNGLSEFNETRGQQRWRNVTEDENAGRLNYRKDDYINYLDGDLESSIYYNNQKTIEDINEGKRNLKCPYTRVNLKTTTYKVKKLILDHLVGQRLLFPISQEYTKEVLGQTVHTGYLLKQKVPG